MRNSLVVRAAERVRTGASEILHLKHRRIYIDLALMLTASALWFEWLVDLNRSYRSCQGARNLDLGAACIRPEISLFKSALVTDNKSENHHKRQSPSGNLHDIIVAKMKAITCLDPIDHVNETFITTVEPKSVNKETEHNSLGLSPDAEGFEHTYAAAKKLVHDFGD